MVAKKPELNGTVKWILGFLFGALAFVGNQMYTVKANQSYLEGKVERIEDKLDKNVFYDSKDRINDRLDGKHLTIAKIMDKLNSMDTKIMRQDMELKLIEKVLYGELTEGGK